MKLHSFLMVTFLVSVPACSQHDSSAQEDSAFAKAIEDQSTSPYFVKIKMVDSSDNREFTTCVTANLLKGAIHIEQGFPYSDEGTSAAEMYAISNQEHAFIFRSLSALQNMPWHPSGAELSEAQAIAATVSDQDLTTSLSSGRLLQHYSEHPRRQERMAALACALIDRGLAPRLADMTGSLYVEV